MKKFYFYWIDEKHGELFLALPENQKTSSRDAYMSPEFIAAFEKNLLNCPENANSINAIIVNADAELISIVGGDCKTVEC